MHMWIHWVWIERQIHVIKFLEFRLIIIIAFGKTNKSPSNGSLDLRIRRVAYYHQIIIHP